ncbi:hypothetical protein HY745_09755 [Candidatus Desantisbacteria bacterium]|nr:hypothetical protein [Candidatus Desantisbacteria bacterium]
MMKRLGKAIILLSIFFYTNILLSAEADTKIKLLSPTNMAIVTQEVSVVIGEIKGADAVELVINSKDKHTLKIEKNTFYDRINLKSGENKIKISALNKGKSIDAIEVKIFYTKDIKAKNNPKEYSFFYFHTMLAEGGECNECHDLKLSIDKYELKKGDRGLCFNCHDERLDLKYVHGPVAGGACLSCHNPHGSENEFTIRYSGDKLCYFCHEEERMKADHLSKLKPEDAKKTCENCHYVHGGDKEFFIK